MGRTAQSLGNGPIAGSAYVNCNNDVGNANWNYAGHECGDNFGTEEVVRRPKGLNRACVSQAKIGNEPGPSSDWCAKSPIPQSPK